MEIFLDSADISAVEKYKDFIDGVTTNPSLMAKKKKERMENIIPYICNIVSGPVSVEVISSGFDKMLEEAQGLAQLHPNVCVKLPCTMDGFKVCKELSKQGIATNLTLCFSPLQAVFAAKCGAVYVSPFIGRVDDMGQDGVQLIEDIVNIFEVHNIETKVLAASIRDISHFIMAMSVGCDAITVPEKVLEQSFTHPMTDLGLKKFLSDWNKG